MLFSCCVFACSICALLAFVVALELLLVLALRFIVVWSFVPASSSWPLPVGARRLDLAFSLASEVPGLFAV